MKMLRATASRLGDRQYWRVEYCCFAWDLKAGCIISLTTAITVLTAALFLNIGLYQDLYEGMLSEHYNQLKDDQNIHFFLVFVYLTVGLAVFSVTFYGVYQESGLITICGIIAVVVIFIFWLFMLVLSFIPEHYGQVCIHARCPDLHWFMESRWRDFRTALHDLDCREHGGKPFGVPMRVISPPKNVTYIRWITNYTIRNKLSRKEYLDKLYGESGVSVRKNKKREVENILLTSSMDDEYKMYNDLKENSVDSLLAEKIPQLFQNSNFSNNLKQFPKKIQSKTVNKTEKGSRDTEYYYSDKPDEEKEEEEEEKEIEEEHSGEEISKISDYIPPEKLQIIPDPAFKIVCITIAAIWCAFMANTILVLIMFLIELRQAPKNIEDEEQGR